MAIPPEQRDPAVHAFVSSTQLMQAADELLPLTAAGEPALPADTLAGQQAEVQAMLLAATAFHIVPEEPEWEGRPMNSLGSYVQRRCFLSRDSRTAMYRRTLQPLGGLLLRHIEGALEDDPQQALKLWTDALNELIELTPSACAALSRQLQQAQRGSPPLLLITAEQLEAAILMQMQMPSIGTLSSLADLLDDQPPGQLDPELLATCLATARASCERLLELEPNNPKACMEASGIHSTAADLGHVVGTPAGQPSSRALSQRAMDLQLRTFRTAKAQGSAYWTVLAAATAVIVATMPETVVQSSDLEALEAEVEGAPTTFRKLHCALPLSWVGLLEQGVAAAAEIVTAAKLHRQSGSKAALDASTVFGAASMQLRERDACSICSGCGTRALGLRRCARCKQAACERAGGCSQCAYVKQLVVFRAHGIVCWRKLPMAQPLPSCAPPQTAPWSARCATGPSTRPTASPRAALSAAATCNRCCMTASTACSPQLCSFLLTDLQRT